METRKEHRSLLSLRWPIPLRSRAHVQMCDSCGLMTIKKTEVILMILSLVFSSFQNHTLQWLRGISYKIHSHSSLVRTSYFLFFVTVEALVFKLQCAAQTGTRSLKAPCVVVTEPPCAQGNRPRGTSPRALWGAMSPEPEHSQWLLKTESHHPSRT